MSFGPLGEQSIDFYNFIKDNLFKNGLTCEIYVLHRGQALYQILLL